MCTEAHREVLLDKIQRHLAQLKRLTYGKHIVSRVEKLLINAAAYAKEVRLRARGPPLPPWLPHPRFHRSHAGCSPCMGEFSTTRGAHCLPLHHRSNAGGLTPQGAAEVAAEMWRERQRMVFK